MLEFAFISYCLNSFLGFFGFAMFALEWRRWDKNGKPVSEVFKLVTLIFLTYGYSQAVAAYSRHITVHHYLDAHDWFYSPIWLTRTVPIMLVMGFFIYRMIVRIRNR